MWNIWTWFGEVPSAQRCIRNRYWMCFEHVHDYLTVSIPKALLPGNACWALKMSWSFLASVGLEYFSVCKLRWWHFTSEGFCMGFFNACEAVRCWSAVSRRERTWQGTESASGWKEMGCDKGDKTSGHVLNTRGETNYWTSFILCTVTRLHSVAGEKGICS